MNELSSDIIDNHLIYSCLTGSHAYGMNRHDSDIDIRGVFILPERLMLSPLHKIEQIEGEGDTIYYEMRKFLFLVLKQNPNILELLWVDEKCPIHKSDAWDIIHKQRQQLLSKKIGHTFGGYASAQMKKMTSHDKWINSPKPKKPPRPCEYMSVIYDMTETARIKKQKHPLPREGFQIVHLHKDHFLLSEKEDSFWYDNEGNLNSIEKSEFDQTESNSSKSIALLRYNRNEYESAKRDWKNYWTWKKNRNPDRGRLEDTLGYDTKNASHLIRLLLMGRDGLKDGTLTIRRPDSDFLLSIRDGKYSYQEIMDIATELEFEIKQALESSHLPDDIYPDLVTDIAYDAYAEHCSSLQLNKHLCA